MFVRTPRLFLRPAWAEDAAAVAATIGDYDIVKNLGRAPWPYTLADAEASLDVVRESADGVTTLPFWIATVDELLAAATDIAIAAQAGDAEALAAAQAAYEAASDEAGRADQALAIALGEAAAGITGPPSAESAEILREVAAARAALAALSILP